MLWYKAWRESRTRFLLSAVTIAGLSAGFVVFHRAAAEISDKPLTYMEYIWRIVYKGYLRELYVLLALLLGVGGLLRERDFGTAGFTLALPVSRLRAAVGLAQVAVLSLLPALVIPSLSPFIGQIYPWPQALQFARLWGAGGALIFMMGFLASSLFAEHTRYYERNGDVLVPTEWVRTHRTVSLGRVNHNHADCVRCGHPRRPHYPNLRLLTWENRWGRQCFGIRPGARAGRGLQSPRLC